MKRLIDRRLAIFFISCLLFILSQFYRASVAVISPQLISDLSLDSRQLSLISASFFYAFAVMQIPVGLYLDSIGPRIAMTVLTLIGAAGALLFALGNTMGVLVAGRTLLGIGMACNLMGTLKLIALWFSPLRFATLSALVISVGTAGNIAATTPLVIMSEAMGWRMTFVVFACINFVFGILFFAVVRDGPEANRQQAVSEPGQLESKKILEGVRALFSEKDYWIISFGTFCRYGIFAAVQALWAGPYLMKVIGVSSVSAGNLLFLMSVGLILGSPFWGWFSDAGIRARKPSVLAGLAGMLIILALFASLDTDAGYVTLVILFFGFGFFSSAGHNMYAHIKERMPAKRAGMAMTGINFFTMVGVAFFLQGLSFLMELFYPGASLSPEAFKASFLFCALCLAVSFLLYTLTRETRTPPNGGRP